MNNISNVTRALRSGLESDSAHGAVVPPIYLSSNFTFSGLGEPRQYDYSRSGNPTRDLLANAVAELEMGSGAVITSSGLAAITAVVTALVRPGDSVLIPHDCYGGTWRLFTQFAEQGLLRLTTVDMTDLDALATALRRSPRLVWIETPSNPLLRITDIKAVVSLAHASGALVAADNTFCSPLGQQPLALGCDIVVHSTTKYINGHSDVVGGAIVAADPEIAEQLSAWSNVIGVTGSPFDSYLTLRGLRTLEARLRIHQENANTVVDLLVDHPAVQTVYWPGLKTHPGFELAASQQNGFGAMVSFDLAGGLAAVRAFLSGLQIFSLAESLGGTESLVCHPATMTHASMTPEALEVAGIGEGLVRLSVGIERSADLVAVLTEGLDRAFQAQA